MRGHEPLIAMRRKGLKPPVVFVDVDALPAVEQWHRAGRLPNVEIGSGESLQRIDWRWAKGLTVHVTGQCGERVRQAAKHLGEEGAERVISSCVERVGDDGEFPAFRCAWVTDTRGHFAPKPEAEHGAHTVG